MIVELANRLITVIDGRDERTFVDCVLEILRYSTLYQTRPDRTKASRQIDDLAHNICRYIAGEKGLEVPEDFRVPRDIKSIEEFTEAYSNDFMWESQYPSSSSVPIDFGRWAVAIVINAHECRNASCWASLSSVLHFTNAVLSSYPIDKAVCIIQGLGKVCLEIEGLQGMDWTTEASGNNPISSPFEN